MLNSEQMKKNDMVQDEPPKVTLRAPVPGDIGWVIHKHGQLYADEYGWDWTFEAMVACIAGNFITNFSPDRERCWIAEYEGVIVGSVFVVQQDQDTAKLRMLYVDKCMRGQGLGQQLVNECVQFARSKGYQRLVLWTNSMLVSARRIYEAAGFVLVEEEEHTSFGQSMIGQTWQLDLR
jgi:GNAT superfamily N-acetyltransferase